MVVTIFRQCKTFTFERSHFSENLFSFDSCKFPTIFFIFPLRSFNNSMIQGILQKFCITDPFSTKNRQIDLDVRSKNFFSPGYNLLFDIISIPNEVFFLLIDEFVDACNILSHVLHFDSLPLQDTSLVLVCFTLNHCAVPIGSQLILWQHSIHHTPRTFSYEFHRPKHLPALKTE